MICRLKIHFSVLILLSGITVNTSGQKFIIPDSLSTPINLPEKYSWDLKSEFEVGYKSSYVYAINDSTRYYSVFKIYKRDSLPVIDFKINELLLYVYCSQCHDVCPDNIPCHRSGCMYISGWYLRKKK